MQFKIVIPARYASSRLPGKPLVDIVGKPMIQHVYERACESGADKIIIATDDKRIQQAAEQFGAEVCMTRDDHLSGTDRIAEVAAHYGFDNDDIIVNVQGDEPCLPASLINQVAQDLDHHPAADIASLYREIDDPTDIFDPNTVKVVTDSQGYALYFSRAPIPWLRNQFPSDNTTQPLTIPIPHYRHIGLYGYRCHFLKSYADLASCDIEKHESLEQLRALYHGKRIHLTRADIEPGHGIDTQAQLEIIRHKLQNR